MFAFPLGEVELGSGWRGRGSFLGPGCSHANPPRQRGHLCFAQPAARRHRRRDLTAHGTHQLAVGRIPRHDHWTRVAAVLDALRGIEHQSGELGLRLAAVTGITLLSQQGTDLLLEELDLLGFGRGNRHPGDDQNRKDLHENKLSQFGLHALTAGTR